MDDNKKIKPESSWVDSGYFFDDTERETSLLNEFGWNLQQHHQPTEKKKNPEVTCFLDFDPMETGSDLSGTTPLLPENHFSSTVTAGTVEKSGDASLPIPSVSSSSSDEQPEKSTASDGKPPDKPTKARKKGQKRIRQQRFAFMTKSDIDHLEDGYRWRKYGQKAVKNSPYPRSYYRCTNSKCTVKKRVERSCEDPTIVITTYEGQHCHHSVSFPRGGAFSHDGAFVSGLNPSASQIYASAMQYPVGGQLGATQLPHLQHEVRPTQMQPEPNSQRTSDEGLLGDIVPSRMRNR